MKEIDDKHLREVCKMGQGEDCCKYILVDPDIGIACAKHDSHFGPILRDRKGMVAQSDNCEGLQ